MSKKLPFLQDIINQSKVLIIGSGMASVSLAKKLSGHNIKVLILEGGEESFEISSELTDSKEYGHMEKHWSGHWIRSIGGNSKVWGGQLAPLDKIDINSRWPIRKESLDQYYSEAYNFLNRTQFIKEEQELNDTLIMKPFSKGSVKRIINEKDIIDKNVTLIRKCHVTRLISRSRRTIEKIAVRYANINAELLVDNRIVVLGCGALGNAQILLQPNDISGTPVGNESGLVGTHLMEHPYCIGASGVITNKFIDEGIKIAESIGARKDELNDFSLNLRINDKTRRSLKLLSCYFELRFISKMVDGENPVVNFAKKKFLGEVSHVQFGVLSEQFPSSLNTVRLDFMKNSVGLHKLVIKHCFSDKDLFSILESTRLLAENFYNNKIGIVRINNQEIFRNVRGVGHIMGTTRMGESISNGVVDRDLRLFGYENMFVIGSSVFTTSGAANPTLTIVALSIRLSEKIRNVLHANN